MRLMITKEHVGEWASYFITKRILDFAPTKDKPFVLGIAAGNTVVPMYQALVQFFRDGVLSFEHVHFFNTGEYIGLSPNNENSLYYSIHHHFLNHVDAKPENIHFFDGSASDIKAEAQRYEDILLSLGGVHLWICGIGDDGHLAFNESLSSLSSRTRDKELAFSTRVANASFFGDIENVPKHAYTVGIGTLLEAEEIVVLAQGLNKARALKLSIEDGVNHMYPASSLQLHKKTTFVADEEAVSELKVKTYRYHKEVEAKSLHPRDLIKGLYQSYYALTNLTLFDGEQYLPNATIIIENDRIKSIETHLSPDTVMTKIDLGGRLVVPGYIDLQLNGCGGADVNHDLSIDTLKIMYETSLRHGTTSFAPTLITSSDDKMLEAIDLINHLPNPSLLGVIGWHFEGPYLSKSKKGIHEERFIRKPSQDMLNAIINAHIDTKIVTLAPEEVEYEDIQKLSNAGVIISMGHTNGLYKQINEKIPAGITMATHLYNAMRPLDSREPGAVGAVLESKHIYAGIIIDGEHSSYASVDIAHKSLGDHLFMVSDAVAPAGTDIKVFEFGGRQITHKDGKCFAEDGTLSGAATLMDECVRNAINHVGISKEEAFRMASLYPARSIKKDNEYGMVREGYKADLAILDEDLFVQGIVANGNYISYEN